MAILFRMIFKNLFFTGWRVLFQHKEPDDMIKDDSPKTGSPKTLEDIYKDKKLKFSQSSGILSFVACSLLQMRFMPIFLLFDLMIFKFLVLEPTA